MSTPASAHIVVGTDGTPDAHAAVRAAGTAAVAQRAVLHLVAVHPAPDGVEHQWQRVAAPAEIEHKLTARGAAEALLDEALEQLAGLTLTVRTHARRGSLARAIKLVAARERASLVVVPKGPERHGLRRVLQPSIEQQLGGASAPWPISAVAAEERFPAVVVDRAVLMTLEQALVGDAPVPAPPPATTRRGWIARSAPARA